MELFRYALRINTLVNQILAATHRLKNTDFVLPKTLLKQELKQKSTTLMQIRGSASLPIRSVMYEVLTK